MNDALEAQGAIVVVPKESSIGSIEAELGVTDGRATGVNAESAWIDPSEGNRLLRALTSASWVCRRGRDGSLCCQNQLVPV